METLKNPELGSIEVNGVTRQAFLLRGALAAGAVYGVSAVTPFVSQSLAATSDVDVLNFALTLEYLETAFYKTSAKYLSGDVAKVASKNGAQEASHVNALTTVIKQLGGQPVTSPTFSFPVHDQASFLKLAQTLEDTGVSAYNGAAPSIQSKTVLGAAGSIVQIEARHASVIRLLNKETPAPNAFDPSLSMTQVLQAVKPLIA